MSSDGFPRLGITLRELHRVVALVAEGHPLTQPADAAALAPPDLSSLSTSSVMSQHLIHMTKQAEKSYCELYADDMPDDIGPATAFVSHAWGHPFLDVIDALTAWEEPRLAAGLPRTFFWFDVFSNNQHKTSERGFDWWINVFKRNVGEIGHTLLVLEWATPRPLTRAWCLWEIVCTHLTGARMDVLMSPRQAASFTAALLQDLQVPLRALTTVDVSKSQAFIASDRDAILAAAAEAPGLEPLNEAVLSRMRNWMLLAGTAARGSLAPEDRDSNQLTHALADLNSELGEVQQAAALFEAAFTARLAALGPDHASTLHSQAMLAWVRGTKPGFTPSDRAWALETSGAVVSALRRIGQLHTEDGLQILNQHSILCKRASVWPEAELCSQEALTGRTTLFGREHIAVLKNLTSHANLLAAMGKHEEAIVLFKEALDGKIALLGESHMSTLSSIVLLASELLRGGKAAEAHALMDSTQCVALHARCLGRSHGDTRSAEALYTKVTTSLASTSV